MDITETVEVSTRSEWRAWLALHHETKREIWLVADLREKAQGLSYLDAVEEALCFGWVDGLAKKYDATRSAQRFTPRRPKSHWTELNKERARRLQTLGLMTAAGERVLPSLSTEGFTIPEDIRAALESEPGALETFRSFPPLYQRVRVGYVDEMRKQPAELAARLANLVAKTKAGTMFGNWDDRGMRRSP